MCNYCPPLALPPPSSMWLTLKYKNIIAPYFRLDINFVIASMVKMSHTIVILLFILFLGQDMYNYVWSTYYTMLFYSLVYFSSGLCVTCNLLSFLLSGASKYLTSFMRYSLFPKKTTSVLCIDCHFVYTKPMINITQLPLQTSN